MLSDGTLRELLDSRQLVVDPYPIDVQIQPASIDLHLGNHFRDPVTDFEFVGISQLVLDPGECMLATTNEFVKIPDNLAVIVDGKSTWGRRFVSVHATAGYIDPGFHGQITLELKNDLDKTQAIPVGAMICQLRVFQLDKPAERPYGSDGLNSHYQGQGGATRAIE